MHHMEPRVYFPTDTESVLEVFDARKMTSQHWSGLNSQSLKEETAPLGLRPLINGYAECHVHIKGHINSLQLIQTSEIPRC